ncbi:kinase-like domain-containing protein [Gigaspora rosea]|uniref:Kinase-like domain-containing protein n=1 Tax=Gigaspora rosea TaxID=44941 RepID=A0A397UKM1_9GLOM|nr:kinase-like domain-containing protein [Gigaspora rosea]
MADSSNKWLEIAFSEQYINCYPYNQFTNFERIGQGGFGTVFKSEWKDPELTVALKTLKNLDKNCKSFIKELAFIPTLSHSMGLQKTLITDIIIWFWNLLVMHSKNILVHKNKIMIADFGLSKNMDEESKTSNSILYGIQSYIDPRCFKDPLYKRNKKSDIYSFGVILWEISSGQPPFISFASKEAIPYHVTQGRNLPKTHLTNIHSFIPNVGIWNLQSVPKQKKYLMF